MSVSVKLTCKRHPTYKAVREPKKKKGGPCEQCVFIYQTLNPKGLQWGSDFEDNIITGRLK